MKSLAAQRWSIRLLGGLLALLAADRCAPVARAECGGHVLVGERVSGPIVPTPLSRPRPRQLPCSGPHCSKGPATPAPVPVSRSAPAAQQWALVPARPTAPEPSPFSALAGGSLIWPVRGGPGVYHPPR
jgi:hypothetical protein